VPTAQQPTTLTTALVTRSDGGDARPAAFGYCCAAANSVCDLVEGLGGTVVGLVFVAELEFLPGRQKLEGYDVRSLIKYQS